MNGIHDLGGKDGLGPILVETDEPVWHAEWEKAAFSFFPQSAVAGYFNLDEFRASMERIDPVEYLSTPYYAHWMHAFEEYLARDDAGFPAELERRTQEYLADPSRPLPADRNPELADIIAVLAAGGAPCDRPVEAAAKFAVGDTVVSARAADGRPAKATRPSGCPGSCGVSPWGVSQRPRERPPFSAEHRIFVRYRPTS